jgi:hypothetical protein
MLALAVGLLILLALAPSAQAQSNCRAFRAISHATLPAALPLKEPDIWGGPVWGFLEGPELLIGLYSGNDGTDYWRGVGGSIGQGKGGSCTFAFNPDAQGRFQDTFTTYVTNAVFPIVPGKIGLGSYQGTHKIVSGTGRFASASGNLLMVGPWLVWPDPTSPFSGLYGRYSAEISGFICNVLP